MGGHPQSREVTPNHVVELTRPWQDLMGMMSAPLTAVTDDHSPTRASSALATACRTRQDVRPALAESDVLE